MSMVFGIIPVFRLKYMGYYEHACTRLNKEILIFMAAPLHPLHFFLKTFSSFMSTEQTESEKRENLHLYRINFMPFNVY
jgi:hypothetical protein